MRLHVLFSILLMLAGSVFATNPPGYATTETVLEKTTHIIVAEISTYSVTNKMGIV